MKSTTIKLEGELLKELEGAKPENQSLSSYIREVLRKDLDRMQVRDAAVEYRAFVDGNEDEKASLEDWDRADLNTPPSRKKGVS